MNTGSYKFVTKEQTSFTELASIIKKRSFWIWTTSTTTPSMPPRPSSGSNCARARWWKGLSPALSSAFRINAEQAELDTRAFVDDLTRYGLISSAALEAGEEVHGSEVTVAEVPAVYQPPQLKVSSSLSHVTLSGSSTIGP